jgi:hypothetical protein
MKRKKASSGRSRAEKMRDGVRVSLRSARVGLEEVDTELREITVGSQPLAQDYLPRLAARLHALHNILAAADNRTYGRGPRLGRDLAQRLREARERFSGIRSRMEVNPILCGWTGPRLRDDIDLLVLRHLVTVCLDLLRGDRPPGAPTPPYPQGLEFRTELDP